MGSSKKSKHEPSPRCTACDKELKNAVAEDLKTHSLLGVLVCKKCFDNYGDGDFTKYENGVDEEGDDNYCRWCADGGDLLVCCAPNCHYAYCKKCIKRNLGRKVYAKISDSEDWHCFSCNKVQISAWIEYAKNYIAKLQAKEEDEKLNPATPEVTKSEPPPKTSVLITPSNDNDFTPSARKKEARAKKSTAKPSRVFEENNEEADDKASVESENKVAESEKEQQIQDIEKEQVNEKESEQVKEKESEQVNEKESEQVKKDEKDEEPKSSASPKRTSSRQSSPRRSTKMFSDVVVEESDGELARTPKRKLCDDVVIEEDDEIENSKNTSKINESMTNTLLSTTIERASDDSDDDNRGLISVNQNNYDTPAKRKAKSDPISDLVKKRRSSITGVNGDSKLLEVNKAVNLIIEETNQLSTEYFQILSQARDLNEINKDVEEKFKNVSSKIINQLHDNVWTFMSLSR